MSRLRVVVAFGLGIVATVASIWLDIPGRGEFILTTLLAGALAAIALPGRWGLVAGLAGVAAGGIAVPLMGLSVTLIALPLTIVGAIFGLGWLSASLGARFRRDGLPAARKPAVIAGLGILVLTIGAAVWFAVQFAANPA